MLKSVDCVMFKVKDVDAAIAFYRDVMGLTPLWHDGEMAGLGFPALMDRGVLTEIVLHNDPNIPVKVDVNYLVEDVPAALAKLTAEGCQVVAGPFPIAIGNCAVVRDPFDTLLTLVDMTRGPRTPVS
jgi:predicted enzyme related to lactoylglutathione lyase